MAFAIVYDVGSEKDFRYGLRCPLWVRQSCVIRTGRIGERIFCTHTNTIIISDGKGSDIVYFYVK